MNKDIVKEILPIEKSNNDKLFKLMNDTALQVINNVELFKKFLDIQSIFDKYSVGNNLLILAQAPNTKQLNSKKQSLKDVEVSLIQPKKDKNRKFNNYKLYSSERMIKLNKYYSDNKLLLKAFLNDCPVDIKVVENIENGKNVHWNNDMKILYIKKGSEYNELFEGITNELTKEELGSTNSELENFKCKCVSYMILKKYNKEASLNVDNIPKEFISDNPKKVREELNELKECLNIFNNRVNSFFNDIYKTQSRNNYKGKGGRC